MPKHFDQLLKYHRTAEERLVNTIDDHPCNILRADLARKRFSAGTVVVSAPTECDYRLPSHFAKTMTKEQLSTLRDLQGRLWSHREALVGMPLHETCTLYNGDPETRLLQDDFATWGEEHLLQRLQRRSTKDQGNAVLTWFRISREFLDWLVKLNENPSSGHSVVLNGVLQHLFWVLYQHTIASSVNQSSDGSFHIVSKEPAHHEFLNQYLAVNRYHLVESFGNIANKYEALGVNIDAMPSEPLIELRHIASDLMEFRGRLLRSYDPKTCIVALTAGMFAGWTWALEHQAGVVYLGSSERVVQRQLGNDDSGMAVCIGLDGQIMCPTAPYKSYTNEHSIRWTLGVLRPLHEKMFSEWEGIGPLDDVEDATGEAAELEAISAACEVLLEEGSLNNESRGMVRVPSVRTSQLFSALEKHFGCKIQRGKGSEIKVFRPGSCIYTLPCHKRNTHYPSWMIRALLKRVGITPVDFAAKVCKRLQHY